MDVFLLTAGFFALGYFFQTLFGFGGAFIIVLGLSLFIPIQPVIAMMPLSFLAVIAVSAFQDRKIIQGARTGKMFLISLPGAVLGAVLLNRIPSRLLVIGVCLLILVWSVYSLTAKRLAIPPVLNVPLFLIAGFVIGATGMGLIFVPLVMQEIEDPAELRASLNFMWLLQGVFRLPIYYFNGLITTQYALMALTVIPFMLTALAAGRWGLRRLRRLNPESFHRMALIFMAFLVLARLIGELAG